MNPHRKWNVGNPCESVSVHVIYLLCWADWYYLWTVILCFTINIVKGNIFTVLNCKILKINDYEVAKNSKSVAKCRIAWFYVEPKAFVTQLSSEDIISIYTVYIMSKSQNAQYST